MNVLAHRRGAKYGAGALVLALTLAACGSSSSKPSFRQRWTSPRTASTTLRRRPRRRASAALGVGHPQRLGQHLPADLRAGADPGFQSAKSGVKVTYDGTGSTAGKKALADGTADFAGTDSPVKTTEMSRVQGQGRCSTSRWPADRSQSSYHLSGVSSLQLSADTLADIFQGKVKKWNDAEIKADNPGASLPSTSITIVHRSDGSGTTSNFTKYLAKASKQFTLTPGETVNWPAGSVGAAKNSGVASAISQTDGGDRLRRLLDRARGEARRWRRSRTQNGEYVAPSLDGATKALDAAHRGRRPDVQPARRVGRRRVPDHVADVDPRVPEADGRHEGRGAEGLPGATRSAPVSSSRRVRTTRRCRSRSTRRRSRRSPSIQSAETARRAAGDDADNRHHAARRHRRSWGDRAFRSVTLASGLLVLVVLALDCGDDDGQGLARVPPRGHRLRHQGRLGAEQQPLRRAFAHLRHRRHLRSSRWCSRYRSASASRCSSPRWRQRASRAA